MPIPLSRTEILTNFPGCKGKALWAFKSIFSVLRLTMPPVGIAWMALMIKFWMTWLICPASTSTGQRSPGAENSQRTWAHRQGNVAQNPGKNIVKVMGNAAGQDAQRGELFHFQEFGFRPAFPGDILEDQPHPADVVMLIDDGGAAVSQEVLGAVLGQENGIVGAAHRLAGSADGLGGVSLPPPRAFRH